jgi:hypothetical protein
MYVFADIFLVVFHTALILFVLAGWAWKRLRPAHLILTTLTLLSWFGLGLRYGFGYCPSTDWHWRIKRELGETDLPRSFVQYCFRWMTGWDWETSLVDLAVLAVGLSAGAASICLNWRDRRSSGIG